VRIALALCLACTASPQATRPAHGPIFDRAIVFGSRVGPISLGMTVEQLFEAVGRVNPTPRGSRLDYLYAKLKLHLRVENGRVVFVAPDDPLYATASGVHLGSTEQELVAKAGVQLVWRHVEGDAISYCFAHTLVTVAGAESKDPICAAGVICDIAVGGC
jgi:hypothetical protein